MRPSENICRCPEGSGAWLPQAERIIASPPFLGTLAPENTSFSGLYGIRVGLEVGTCFTVVEYRSEPQIPPHSVSIAPSDPESICPYPAFSEGKS